MSKVLDVKNLKISFRTNNSTVKAVRDISFSLNKGETLAIVGESGSGKSVTSKAILGISAGNAIVESGEIIYDGQDLIKIGEEDFHQIRGDKIAMIFQDPMSSLNPIMKIGKQLTEAMILKGKARQKASRETFNGKLELLKNTMIKAVAEGGYTNLTGERIQKLSVEEIEQLCKDFDTFEFKHIELEQAFNEAHEAAEDALPLIEDELFHIEKNAFKGYAAKVKQMCSFASRSVHEYVVNEHAARLQALVKEIPRSYKAEENRGNFTVTAKKLEELRSIIKHALSKDAPDFFRMGYYLTFANKPLPNMPVKELNEYLLKYLDDNFMLRFLGFVEVTLRYSAMVYD
jgi:predicted ABC-type transport system involved in lysophospholipase L1 biosynthesis ATPase subunit